jgi:hypothetical protein
MKRADFQADTNQGVWAKSESLGRSAKAHFWLSHQRRHDYAGSLCGMLYATDSLVVADHHTQRCKRCEASK